MQTHISRRSARRAALAAAIAACSSGFFLVPLAGAAQAAGSPVTDLGATTIYYDGATVSATLNGNGDSFDYGLVYGPAGAATTTTWGFGTSATGPAIPISIAVSQLTAGTAYSYTWQTYDTTTGDFETGPSGTFTAGALAAGPPVPIVPPANPAAVGMYAGCGSDAECVADINGVRNIQESLAPIVLPTNWGSLTSAEQIFVFADIERVSRGLAPIPSLVNTYDSQLATGLANDADPVLPVPYRSIWAGSYATPTGAFLGWEYFDGPGGANLDCTTPTAPGCWGHRDNILASTMADGVTPVNEMDAAAGNDSSGNGGYVAAFYNDPGTPAAGSVVFTWAQEQPFLAGP